MLIERIFEQLGFLNVSLKTAVLVAPLMSERLNGLADSNAISVLLLGISNANRICKDNIRYRVMEREEAFRLLYETHVKVFRSVFSDNNINRAAEVVLDLIHLHSQHEFLMQRGIVDK